MKATRQWHCECGCEGMIEPGEEFLIRGGVFYRSGHETPDALEEAGISPKREIVNAKKTVSQQEVTDLPLFNSEYQQTEQIKLF
jgi:hypothetical protein